MAKVSGAGARAENAIPHRIMYRMKSIGSRAFPGGMCANSILSSEARIAFHKPPKAKATKPIDQEGVGFQFHRD
jgi:hypothetical protein